jgi:pimeloyl-ACP methyl ester carboxylesterase
MGLAQNADALEEFLLASGAQSPLTVVGHSLGGGVALELAIMHPERVGALVLVGSVGVAGALSRFDRVLAVPILGNGILRAGVAALRRGLITAARYSERHPEARVAKKVAVLPTLQMAIGTDSRPTVGRSRQSFLVEQRALLAETPQLEADLGRIAVPTAVVNGASDRLVPLSAARSLAALVPGAELVVMAGGHLLPFDRPEKLAEIVRRYSQIASEVRDGRQRRGTPEA